MMLETCLPSVRSIILSRAYSCCVRSTSQGLKSSKCVLAFQRLQGRSSEIPSRFLGSSVATVEKSNLKTPVEHNFSEKTVTIYTCENIYDRWRKERTFRHIPKSGVFAKLAYIDTFECKDKSKPHRTVICIHGIPGNCNVFSHLIKDLSQEDIRVIVPTFPDTLYLPGKHGEEFFRHSVEEKTQVFKDFLNELNVSELDCVIAHSSGVYPALHLALDPNLKVKCQVLFNTGGHKKPVTMKPYWIVWTCSQLYLYSFGRLFIQKTGKFIMKYILRAPFKDDNLDGIVLLAITMINSQYWKAREQFSEIARKRLKTLYCFSEDDKVVERKLSYEVITLLNASKENISFYDEEAKLQRKV